MKIPDNEEEIAASVALFNKCGLPGFVSIMDVVHVRFDRYPFVVDVPAAFAADVDVVAAFAADPVAAIFAVAAAAGAAAYAAVPVAAASASCC